MSDYQGWRSFTPAGKRIFGIIFANGIIFSVGLYVAFRWFLNLASFALPMAAALFVVDALAAFSAARAVTRAEQGPGTTK